MDDRAKGQNVPKAPCPACAPPHSHPPSPNLSPPPNQNIPSSLPSLTTKKLAPSMVRCPTPANKKPVTVSSSPITPTSLPSSSAMLLLDEQGESFEGLSLCAFFGGEMRG